MQNVLDLAIVFLMFFLLQLGVGVIAKTRLGHVAKLILAYVYGGLLSPMALLVSDSGWLMNGIRWIQFVYFVAIVYTVHKKIEGPGQSDD